MVLCLPLFLSRWNQRGLPILCSCLLTYTMFRYILPWTSTLLTLLVPLASYFPMFSDCQSCYFRMKILWTREIGRQLVHLASSWLILFRIFLLQCPSITPYLLSSSSELIFQVKVVIHLPNSIGSPKFDKISLLNFSFRVWSIDSANLD